MDLQKASDLVNHNIIVKKLVTEFNIDSFLVKLVASLLSSRSQVVKYLNPVPFLPTMEYSKVLLLGPLLSSAMINCLAKKIS